MRRTATLLLSLVLITALGVGLVGCDDSPTSVTDFDIQPRLETPGSLSLVLTEGTVDLSLSYQGLDEAPTVETTGSLQAESAEESGSPQDGGQRWTLSYDGEVEGSVTEQAIVQATGEGRAISDTVKVTVSPFLIQSDFSPTFASVADFEERSLSTSGGTSVQRTEMVVPDNSTGDEALEVSGSGSATIERTTSAAGADRFAFLLRPDESTEFTLTFSFTEETGSGTTTHDLDVLVPAGTQWAKYTVAFDQISPDFNPVASRAGGNGALQSISMSSDQDVTYYVDEIVFANEDQTVAEVHDFEETSNEYNCPALSVSQDVADPSDGVRARNVEAGGCFGYNFQESQGGAPLVVDAEAGDVLSFWAKSAEQQTRDVFVQTANNNAGGYTFDNGVDVTIPGGDEWTKIEVPVENLGDEPAALENAGITNVGFDGGQQVLIDQIRFEPGN